MPRFVVLDSWRGICACIIVLLHFRTSGVLTNLPIVINGYLFVDFFFVLSGFVIHGNYRDRVGDTSSLIKFFFTRFGRLYPLHLFMLACFIALQTLQFHPSLRSLAASPPFSGEALGFYAILTNLGLLHGLGMHGTETWNSPSWSISTELWAYVYFALATMLLRKKAIWLAAAACLLAPLFLALNSHDAHVMNTTFEYGFIRCLFGFSAGMIAFELYHHVVRHWHVNRLQASLLEIGAVFAILIFISNFAASNISLAAPALFSLTILVFTPEKGIISSALLKPFPAMVGMLSYSIYMTHMFIIKFWVIGGIMLGKLLHYPLIQTVPMHHRGGAERSFGHTQWQGDLAAIAMLGSVILVSYFTYKFIEDPWRLWFRDVARSKSFQKFSNWQNRQKI